MNFLIEFIFFGACLGSANRSTYSRKAISALRFFSFCCFTILWIFMSVSASYTSDSFSHRSWMNVRACPYLFNHIFKGYTPMGNTDINIYRPRLDANGDLGKCVQTCCDSGERSFKEGQLRADEDDYMEMCNAIIMVKGDCYHVICKLSTTCAPNKNNKSKDSVMVLVRPPLTGDESQGWEDIIDLSEDVRGLQPSRSEKRLCRLGMESECLPEEECVPNAIGDGSCICRFGIDSESGRCVTSRDKSEKDEENDLFDENAEGSMLSLVTAHPEKLANVLKDIPANNIDLGSENAKSESPISSSSPPLKNLEVTVVSKTVRLPENEVTLSAFTIPTEKQGEHYTYEWNLLSRPGGNEAADTGTMQDKNGPNLQLRHLKEGFYSFQVTVTGPDSTGKQVANVTVLPPNRINSPPIARVTPVTQVVHLPNSGAVLDGSASSDDDQIVSWRWELQQGPLGYQPHLPATSTLQLDNLTLPGNYTFKLTVVDSDGAESSAVGKVKVVKERDYPPEANAGQDVIVYLPHNAVILQGNRSTDDRGIVSWEWTKRPGDKAVDMQNTRTPFLQLSNLEEGMYTFVLRVWDNSGQNSSAEVHVFVKPPTNEPPIANAGGNATISLPRTWFLLDGSKSTDDVAVVSWLWQQISGPSEAVLIPLEEEKKAPLASESDKSVSHSYHKGIKGVKVNATDLTKGIYIFRLNVTDADGNNASENISISVNQPVNAPPKADGGGDQTIVAGEGGPGWLIVADGRHSSDDLAITSWRWTRDPSGLAAGKVVGDSDRSPVLKVVDAVPGRYVFVLRVTDEQGAFDEDTVSIIVKPDPKLLSMVEVWLNIDAGRLTTAQVAALEARLTLLLPHPAVPRLVELKPDYASGRTVLVFYAQEESNSDGSKGNREDAQPKRAASSAEGNGEEGKVLAGPLVADRLRQRLLQDPGLLELSVARVQTVVCQNTCSRHGVCEQSTRRCLCEAFWMQDPVRKFLGDGVSNCDWSILYVVVGACAVVVVTVFSGWAIACLCQHLCGACCSSQGPSASDNALQQHRSKRHHRRSGRRNSSSPRKSSSSCSWPWCCAGGSGGEGAPSKGAHRRRSRYLPLGEEESGRGEDEDDNDEEDAMLHASPAHLVKCQPSLSEASNSDDVVFELNTQGSNRYNGTRRVKT